MELYAEQHGEWSPMNQKIFLPAGKKSHYHATYCYERFPDWHEMQLTLSCSKFMMFKIVLVLRSQQDLAHLDGAAAELAVFRRAWAVELPWVVLAKSESLFTGCTVCSYLQGLIDSCPRDQKVVMQALRARLGKHFSFQGAQRLAIQKIQESARRSDGDEWILGSDKLPRVKFDVYP